MGLWNAETGELLRRYVVYNTNESFYANFSPDGQQIISIAGNLLITWENAHLQPDPDTWTIENRYIPDFTCEQRELYRIDPRCENDS